MPGLIVADDAEIIRSTVARVVSGRKELGLFPVVQARNGQEAIELARQMAPDVVIMDIKMPGLDGLEAASIIRREFPTSKLIILTAYDEFPYVQEALKLGAVDFLLKPVRPAKLLEVLAQVKGQLQQEQAQQAEVEKTRTRWQKALPLVEASLIESLISGLRPEGATHEEALQQLGKTISWPVVAVARINRFGASVQGMSADELHHFYTSLTDIVRQTMPQPDRALVGFSRPGRVIAIVSADQDPGTVDELRGLGETIARAISAGSSVTATVGLGNRYPELNSVPLSYAEAGLACRHSVSQDQSSVVHISDVHHLSQAERLPYPVQLEQELLHAVRLGQAQNCARLMTELVDFLMYQSKKSPQTLHDRLAELMTLISRAVIEAGGEAAKVLDLSHRQAVALAERQTVAEIRAWALNSLAELMTTIQPALVNKDLVQQAIEYIHENQRQPEMTLKDVASAVNLSPSHLAYLLKENLGVSYKKYLTSLRMGQAKKLLRTTDLTVTAIAQAVGYPNTTNFYRLFQRETGTTPADYRHSI